MRLGLTLLVVLVACPVSSADYLELVFTDESATYDPDQMWISFDNGGGDAAFDVTYNSGTAVTIGTYTNGGNTFTNHLSNPIKLSTVTDCTFQLNSVTSVAVYVTYAAPFSDLEASPSFFKGAPGADVDFQNFEITRVGKSGDQGNLTNINYFTAPMSISSYSSDYGGGTTALQSTGFSQTADQIARTLSALSPSNTVTDSGILRRFVGPSSWTSNPPYQSFAGYLASVHKSGVSNTIKNRNAFNTNGSSGQTGTNYNFIFNLTSTILADNTISLTGTINTQVKDNVTGVVSAGTAYQNADITISASDMAKMNAIIYGQVTDKAGLNSAVTWGDGWTQWAAFVQNPANNLTDSFPVDYTIDQLAVPKMAIGEITSAILMGFLGNEKVINGTGLNEMASEDWWTLDPTVAFAQIQNDVSLYDRWANAIYDASNNGSYSIPYSDRLGQGPLINSVQYTINGTSYSVDRWEVGIGEPIRESAFYAIWSESDTGDWSTATNWHGGAGLAHGTDSIIFFDRATATASNQDVANPYGLGALYFQDVQDGFVLSGNPIDFSWGSSGAIGNNDGDGHSVTISNDLVLTNPTTLGGTGTGTTTLSGVISGAGGLTIDGSGRYLLTNANTFTNDVTIHDGTLEISADNQLGDAGNAVIFNGPGTLELTTTFDTARDVTVNSSGGNINVLATKTVGLTGTVSGPGALGVNGPGTLRIDNTANDWAGATRIGATSTLQLGVANVIPDTSAVTVEGTFDLNEHNETIGDLGGSGTLVIGDSNLTITNAASTFSGNLPATTSGSGLIEVAGGKWTLSGNNSAYDGSLGAAGGGTLAATSANALTAGSATITLANGTLEFSGSFTNTTPFTIAGVVGGTLQATGGQAATHDAAINGTAPLKISGDGNTPVILGTSSSIATMDVTILQDGKLQLGDDNQLIAGTTLGIQGELILGAHSQKLGSVTGDGRLSINGGTFTSDGTVGPDIFLDVDGGTLNANGGTLSQTGDVTGSGPLAITGGQVTMGTTTKTLTGPITIQNSGILRADQALSSTTYTIAPGGQLTVGANNALPTTSNVINNGTLSNGGFNQKIAQLGGTNAAATVTIGTGDLTVSGAANATYAGTITSAGGRLVKGGAGTWTLSGNSNAFNRTLAIDGGTILVTGTLGDGTAHFTVGGTAGGDGVWDGTMRVQRRGSVAPGNSIGEMTVKNYVPAKGSYFDVELGDGGRSGAPTNDKLRVTGTASLKGNGIVRPALTKPLKSYSAKDTWTILDASAGTLSGGFQAARSNVAMFRLKETRNGLVRLTFLGGTSYSHVASTTNQSATSGALEGIGARNGNDGYGSVFSALHHLPASRARDALDDISPAHTSSKTVVQGEQARMLTGSLQRHLDGQRNGASPQAGKTSWLDLPMLATTAGNRDALALTREAMPNEGETAAGNWALWFRVGNTWANQRSTREVPGYDAFTTNLTMGADHPILPGIRAGVLMGYSHSDLDYDSHTGTGEIDALRLAVYGTLEHEGFYADLAVGGGYDWYENTRYIDFMGTKAKSDHNGYEFLTFLSAGYDWKWQQLTVGPFAGLQYLHVMEDGYQERGAGALNLDMSRNSSDSLQQALGVRAMYDIACKDMTITPQVRAEWLHEYKSEAQGIGAQLPSPGNAFTVTGQEPAADALRLDVGMDVDFGQGLGLQVFYEWYQAAGNDATSHTISAALRYEF